MTSLPPNVNPDGPLSHPVHPAAGDMTPSPAAGSTAPPPAQSPDHRPGAVADILTEVSVADILDEVWERVEAYHELDDQLPWETGDQRHKHLQSLLDVVRDLHPSGHIRNALIAVAAHAIDWILLIDDEGEPTS